MLIGCNQFIKNKIKITLKVIVIDYNYTVIMVTVNIKQL